MHLVVPYTSLRPETAAALDATGRPWHPADVSGDDTAYFRLLSGLWAAGETFGIVEHDVTVSAEALDSLDGCPADWCSAPYPYVNGLYPGLGCARFRAPLLARCPGVMAEVGVMSGEGHPPRHWCRLDAYLNSALTRRGERQCRDHPAVGHPAGRASHGCVT